MFKRIYTIDVMMQTHAALLSTTTHSFKTQQPISTEFFREFLRECFKESEVFLPNEQALLLAAAAAALNESELTAASFHAGFDAGTTAHEFYEIILQTYLFAGFPAALEGVAMLKAVCDQRSLAFVPPNAERTDTQVFTARGETLCKEVYTTAHDKMRRNLITLSPDLASWMIVEGYGKTLSRHGVSGRLRELAIVSVLAVQGWNTQLHSHLRGAMNLGATPFECVDTLRILTHLATHLRAPLQTVVSERLVTATQLLEHLLDKTSDA
jgi:4-carboxymuconolactone decarboxylase